MFIQRVSKTAAAMSRPQLKGPVPMLVNDFSSRKIDKYPRPLHSKKHGVDILKDSLWNKSLAFSQSERDRLGLRGLIPPAVRSIEDQVDRVLGVLRSLPDNIQKNLYLQDLHNRNETLYHRLLVEHVAEIAPLIYTPTVGDVCKQFGHRYTRARGMYFSSEDRGHMSTMVHNWPHDDVHVIVVTDGSRILGLGDLGVHGMGIPIGKLALYCGAGGIAPHRVLPITLDVGTNNEKLLADCNYVGLKQKRITGDEYYDIVDEFMAAVFSRWPGVVVQFEDFETPKAVPLLAKYRDKYRCFNDDIQGTGSVTLAGLIAAARNAGSSVTDMRVLCAGAGSAGLGVCSQIVDGMVEAGLTREEAMSRFVVCTSKGALGRSDGKYGDPNHKRGLTDLTTPWVNPAISDGATMLDAVKDFKPTVLLGLSTIPGIFTEEMIRTMASQCDKPIIMPMSNPTDKSECTPAQAYEWTNGKAVVATGSPFPSYTLPDGRVLTPSQCNNMYIFPGIGLAASVAGITKITDKMLYKASVACADAMNEQEKAEGRTFANLARIRDVSHAVAVAVINEGLAEKLTTKITARHLAEGIPALVSRKMYFPDYVPLL